MRRIDRLKREAMDSARWRGHRMTNFANGGTEGLAHAFCLKCPAMVLINVRPHPRAVPIGGAAVAVNCPACISAAPARVAKASRRTKKKLTRSDK